VEPGIRPGAGALRAEHDALAERLGTRRSVDRMKEGGLLGFFSVIAFGMTCKLAWDRWGWLPSTSGGSVTRSDLVALAK